MSSSGENDKFFDQVRHSLDKINDPRLLGQLSRIEVDLIKERLRDLYDRLSAAQENSKKTEAPVKEAPVKKEEKTAPEVEFEIPASPSLSPAAVEEKIQQSETDPGEIESDEILSTGTTAAPQEPATDKKAGQPDLFSVDDRENRHKEKTVAESIPATAEKESVADKLHKQSKVASLKSIIGINEKFFFINELFEGNLNEYNAAIDALDKMSTLEETTAMLEELASKYKWDGHPEATGQLKEFLERKLS